MNAPRNLDYQLGSHADAFSHNILVHVFRGRKSFLFLCHAHSMSECLIGLPLCAGHRSSFFQHFVHLLQCQVLRLGDKEKGKQEGKNECTTPNKENLSPKVTLISVHNVWCDDCNDTVPEPIGGCRKANAFGTNRKGIDLSDDDPCTRAPGDGEGRDVAASEYDKTKVSVPVSNCDSHVIQRKSDLRSVASLFDSSQDGDNELADTHGCRTPEE